MHSVEIKHLDLSFGSISVLKDLNLDIQDGEFLVLLGASGCGKSTPSQLYCRATGGLGRTDLY